MLFSFIHGAEDVQRSVFVDIVTLLPVEASGKVLVSDLPDKVKLTLRGSQSLLDTIARDGIDAVQIDLREAPRQYFYFEAELFSLPAGVKATQIVPAFIHLKWAKRTERRISVVPEFVSESPSGVVVGNSITRPENVLVRGPETELRVLTGIPTESINLADYGEGEHRVRVALRPLSEHIVYATRDKGVEVFFVIRPVLAHKMLRDVQVQIPNPSWSAVPPRVNVTLRGSSARLRTLLPTDIQVLPARDLSKLHGAHRTSLSVTAADGLDVINVFPEHVVVREKQEE